MNLIWNRRSGRKPPPNRPQTMDHSAKPATALQDKDPVCGMTVDPATAKHKLEHAGKTYYFCCASCLEKFRANPEGYLSGRKTPAMGTQIISIGAAPGAQTPESKASQIKIAPAPVAPSAYVCPMCPEVRAIKPGPCPRCGMALEPEMPVAAARVEYTCPMHPEIVRPGPGSCPICGMALEPRTVTAQEEENPELRDMTRRFWISVALTAPLLAAAMADMLPGMPVQRVLPTGWVPWIEMVLATPVVLWGGWPFFQRGWTSIVNRATNMFTLIAMGTGVAYLYSLVATVFPQIFPASFRVMGGTPPVYFEAAAAITTLVLLGQVLELRARSRTGAAIRALLDLSPKMARVLRILRDIRVEGLGAALGREPEHQRLARVRRRDHLVGIGPEVVPGVFPARVGRQIAASGAEREQLELLALLAADLLELVRDVVHARVAHEALELGKALRRFALERNRARVQLRQVSG